MNSETERKAMEDHRKLVGKASTENDPIRSKNVGSCEFRVYSCRIPLANGIIRDVEHLEYATLDYRGKFFDFVIPNGRYDIPFNIVRQEMRL